MMNIFDHTKFIVRNRPSPSPLRADPNEPLCYRTEQGEPYPACLVTFDHRDYKTVQAIEKQHRLERQLYNGLKATITKQNLYLLEISEKRYNEQVKYCVKFEWSQTLEETENGPFMYQWVGCYGWIILDFLKQVEDWNKC